MERRLAAILAADMVGFSRLMGQEEAATLARLDGLKAEILDPLIVRHHGRVVKLTGDGFLVEFASVVNALTCALDWQRAVEARAGQVPEERAMRFRIGVNLGDVIVKGGDVYGDGVNVAARLEALAEPGSVLVSRTVFDHAKGKLGASFEDLGEHALKNIAEPVRVFRATTEPEIARAPTVAMPTPKSKRLPVIVTIVALLLAAAAIWLQPWEAREEPASREAMAFPLPDKPSIAVLPFDNMSDNPNQDYFADGMTEDLITDLSKISGLFVIARNSSFSYKGQQVKARQVAEELGVRYVLEGSVRRVGAQVRINAQLTDTATGGQLWAERYDGTLEDIFGLQDQVTQKIVTALAVSLTGEKQVQRARHETENAVAHDAYLQGWARYKLMTPKSLAEAVPFFEEALRLDPAYAQAHAALASLYWDVLQNDWAFALDMPSMGVEEFSNLHLEEALKNPTPLAHAVQARMLASRGFYDDAVLESQKAVALGHNDATVHAGLADALVVAGRAAEAVEPIVKANRLDPHHPQSYHITLGAARFGMKQYETAAEIFERAAKLDPDTDSPLIYLASSYGHLGRIEDADDAIETANNLRSTMGLGELSIRSSEAFAAYPSDKFQINFKRFGSKVVQDHLRAGLTEIPALKWQYLITVHRILEPGNSRFEVEGATQIDIPTAKSFDDRGVVFIDMSGESFWNAGHIPGAVRLSWERTGDRSRVRFSKTALLEIAGYNDEIVLYFDNGSVASAAWGAAKAVTWGYRKVYLFDGGTKAWKDAGYPVETG